ncbi:MAG: mechanosensitive ion channel [Planctomycetes bacterium]|nr:mechanosensitive ion channel [Planctomycetota bacterium]
MRPWMQRLTLLALMIIAGGSFVSRTTAQTGQPPSDGTPEKSADDRSTSKPEEPLETTPPQPDVDPKLAKALGSPHATMKTFLEAMDEGRLEDAATCLDLSELTATEEARKTKEQELAHKLKEVLDKLVRVETSQYPEDAELDVKFSLADAQYIEPADREIAEKIVISQSDDGLWRFDTATIVVIEELYELLLERGKVQELNVNPTTTEPADVPVSIWLAELFPVGLRKTRFFLPTYQWIGLAAVVLLGLLADRMTRMTLALLMKIWFRVRHRSRAPVVPGMWRPVGLFMQCLTWYLLAKPIGLPLLVLTILLVGLKYFAVIAGVWTSFHLIDLAARMAGRRAANTPSRFDDLLVPLLSKSLKLVAACVGIVICVNAFGWEVAGLLGGLGIGGMALAFASQDAIGNVFGSLTVLLDRPFEVGDWIVSDGVEGNVETVGFRSTRIRTFYNSVITIPNNRFTTSAVDNMGQRQFRRFKTSIGVQYDTTPEQIDAFCEGIRELLRRHPYTRKDYYHVYFNDFDSSSLNILLYCFFECPEWSVELRERHRLLVDIMKLASQLRVQFAFPTRTIQMFQGDPSPTTQDKDWSDPHSIGLREAAQVAGPVLSHKDRPGDVLFPGPANV